MAGCVLYTVAGEKAAQSAEEVEVDPLKVRLRGVQSLNYGTFCITSKYDDHHF